MAAASTSRSCMLSPAVPAAARQPLKGCSRTCHLQAAVPGLDLTTAAVGGYGCSRPQVHARPCFARRCQPACLMLCSSAQHQEQPFQKARHLHSWSSVAPGGWRSSSSLKHSCDHLCSQGQAARAKWARSRHTIAGSQLRVQEGEQAGALELLVSSLPQQARYQAQPLLRLLHVHLHALQCRPCEPSSALTGVWLQRQRVDTSRGVPLLLMHDLLPACLTPHLQAEGRSSSQASVL